MSTQSTPASASPSPAGPPLLGATPVAPSSRLGVGLMVTGVFLFALNDVLGKWLVGSYGVGQILIVRSITCLIILAPFYWRTGLRPLLRAPRPGLQILRGLFSAMEVALFYTAVIWLPLGDAVTFYMAGPIYVAALAAVLLRERTDTTGWLAISAGFIGVIVALEPGGASFTWPALIALAGSMLFACSMIITRYLRGTPDVVLVTGTMLGALVIGFVMLPFGGWKAAPAVDLALMAWLGGVALIAHVCVNRSLKLAPATVVAPYQYLLIVFAMALAWVAFGEQPRVTAMAGSAIIVAAGIVVFLRERRLNGRIDANAETPPLP